MEDQMSRSTSFIGFTETAKKIITSGKLMPVRFNGEVVLGMFGEEVWKCQLYIDQLGVQYEEYVQAAPIGRSGPCIFMALRNAESKMPLKISLWTNREIAENI